MRDLFVEFMGTFFLVLTVGLSGGDPLAIGSVLMVMVYFGGHFSGGHYNPAVSVAVWIRGRLRGGRLVPYVGAQVLGGAAAGLAYFYIRKVLFLPVVSKQLSWEVPVFAEFLFSLALCSVVLATATSQKLKGNQIYGLAVGFTLLVGVACIGSISGIALNPAVGTGPALSALVLGSGPVDGIWMYWLGPILGGVGAGLIYRFLYRI